MPFDTALMQKFIDEHQSKYTGKYRFHSGYRNGDYSFKNRYYMFDENFELQEEDIMHVFCRMNEKHKKTKIYKAIYYLMKNLMD